MAMYVPSSLFIWMVVCTPVSENVSHEALPLWASTTAGMRERISERRDVVHEYSCES